MTHLRIEQNNIPENVSSGVITKLYELATSGDLDQNSNLAGTLTTNATYQEYIDELEEQFNDLHITASNIYIMFADPEVQRVLLANNIGDNIGVTIAQAASATYAQVGSIFRSNTTITQFDELRYFTGLTQMPSFNGCENLQHVQLPTSVTNIGTDSISSCVSLVSLGDTSNLTTFNPYQSHYYRSLILDFTKLDNLTGTFRCSYGAVAPNSDVTLSSQGLTTVYFDGFAARTLTITSPITTFVCKNATNLQTINGLNNITFIDTEAFKDCSNLVSTDIDNTKITSIANGAFRQCSKLQLLENIYFPNLQTIWPELTFQGCTNIKHIIDLGSITSFPITYGGCFHGCTGLLDVILPESLTSINTSVFDGCSSLRWIKVLSNSVPTYTHSDTWGRTNYYCFGEQWNNNGSITYTGGTETYTGQTYPIYVKDSLLSSYQSADGWKDLPSGRLRPLSQFATDFPNE